MKMKKKLFIFIGIFIVIMSALYISYGFIYAKVYNNETSKQTTYINQILSIDYSDGTETLTSGNTSFIPGSVITKEFSIKNTGNVPLTYNVILTDLINEFKRPADITYELYLNDEMIEQNTFPIYNEETIAGNITIGTDETQKFVLKVIYNNSNDNQIIDNGSALSAKLSFEEEINKIENVLIYGNTLTNEDSTTKSLGEDGTIILSVNKNLVKNGFGEYKDNTNFKSLEYSSDKATSVSKGSLKFITENYSEYKEMSELIPIDINGDYNYSMYIKNNGNESSKFYIGYESFDVDKLVILSQYINYVVGSTTYLTQDLNPGDTEVHLASTSGFKLNEDSPYYSLGLIIWNYIDSTGYQYPAETYSRNVYQNIYSYNNVTENIITLNNGWSGETIPSGTKVSQSYQGSTHNYPLYTEENGTVSKESWNYLNTNINGINIINEDKDIDPSKFRMATKYISIYFNNTYGLEDYSNTNLSMSDIYIGNNNMTIEKTITISSPLKCINETCDYIDIKNKQIVRQVSDGSILKTPTYEDIDVPDLALFNSKMIKVTDGNIESSNIKVEYK